MMSRWQHVWRLLPLFALVTLVLTGCGNPDLSALIPQGPAAEDQYWLIKLSLYIMLFVMAVVFGLFFYVIIRFRQRPGQTGIPEQVEGNHKLEIIWTVVPILLLVVLAIPTVALSFKYSETTPDPAALKVKVTAHQFWWEFEYPDLGVAAAQDLYIPAGKKVQFELTSADVIHSFWVPSLGGKIDTNPGLTTTLELVADKPGVYKGKCAELCGASHALMDFKVVAVTPEEFDAWVNKMKTAQAQPATGLAAQGQEVFQKSCIGCHAVGGQGGKAGPNLDGFADRKTIAGILDYTDENLKKWLKDPQAVKPGNKMVINELSDQEVDALVEYLNTLKIE